MSYAISANRLTDGIVIFLARDGWVETLAGAERFADKKTAEAALAGRAQPDAARNLVVEPTIFEVLEAAGPLAAAHIREAIRARGPTVRPDLGKQSSSQA